MQRSPTRWLLYGFRADEPAGGSKGLTAFIVPTTSDGFRILGGPNQPWDCAVPRLIILS
jgi:alkylation response protein AidB-like acyl-CoA dehydrogenase